MQIIETKRIRGPKRWTYIANGKRISRAKYDAIDRAAIGFDSMVTDTKGPRLTFTTSVRVSESFQI